MFNFHFSLGLFDANFQAKPNDASYWSSFDTPYDYYSIMHYSAFAFSSNGRQTIVTTDPSVQWLIGKMQHMSPIDAKQIGEYYRKQCSKFNISINVLGTSSSQLFLNLFKPRLNDI